MRTFGNLLITLVCGAALAAGQLSPRFQTVYILSMSNSLDQYLASRLTQTHVLWVVLEPSSADAVLTDRVDDPFWDWMARTYPVGSGASGTRNAGNHASDTTANRQRGTIFLVDPRSKVVLWSTQGLPKNTSPTEMDRTAARISTQLKAAFGKK